MSYLRWMMTFHGYVDSQKPRTHSPFTFVLQNLCKEPCQPCLISAVWPATCTKHHTRLHCMVRQLWHIASMTYLRDIWPNKHISIFLKEKDLQGLVGGPQASTVPQCHSARCPFASGLKKDVASCARNVYAVVDVPARTRGNPCVLAPKSVRLVDDCPKKTHERERGS